MSAIPAIKTYTAEEYLALERSVLEGKSEFIDGQVFAMAGASRRHNLIVVNIASELRSQLKGRACEVYASDMRVKAAEARNYHYPDIGVVCGPPVFEDGQEDTLLNPVVLIEVLSPSTEAYDRGGKFASYRRIFSVQEYLLVSQGQAMIEHYRRQGEAWILMECSGLEEAVKLESIGCQLALRDVYARVFEHEEPDAAPV
jgi:Uma2 family endonuclease